MLEEKVSGSLIELAHRVVAEVIRPGDKAVDGTLGNGHDALFLAKCVGEEGRLYGFDVQQDAINATRRRLAEAGVGESVCKLYCECHQTMAEFVPGEVRVVMFNLGYLPGGDKQKITRVDSTLAAVEEALKIILPGGVVTVMCYPGHEGGAEEASAVRSLLECKDGKGFELSIFQRAQASESTPFLLLAKKTASPR